MSLSLSALDRVNCISAMIAFDDSTCCSRRFPHAAIADADGVILTILAGGGRAIASAMKLTARSCKEFPEVVVDVTAGVGCLILDGSSNFLFLL